jgi:hypothetical protein
MAASANTQAQEVGEGNKDLGQVRKAVGGRKDPSFSGKCLSNKQQNLFLLWF